MWKWTKTEYRVLSQFANFSKHSEVLNSFKNELPVLNELRGKPDGCRQMVEAVYKALAKREVRYSLEEYNSSQDSQQIRTPTEIIDSKSQGTCLDLAVLFCGMCLRYELIPLLIVSGNHAWVAVSLTHWLHECKASDREGKKLFKDGLLTDEEKVAELCNLVEDEEAYIAIECTGFTQGRFSKSFDEAEQEGLKRLRNFSSRNGGFILDVPIAHDFSWRDLCTNRLEAEPIKRLINSPLMNGENPLLKLYVPLGLIERKPDAQRRPKENASPPEESPFNEPDYQYEVVREYEHKEFFEEVLKHKSSSRSQGKRLAIVGDPGGGKTTLLQRIAYWVLEEEQGLPIWVPLSDVNENWVQGIDEKDEGWLYRYLSKNWLKNVVGEPEKTPIELQQAFKELLKSGQVWLLLDGADEMVLRHSLTRVKKQLAKGWADSVRVVLNCRLNLWEVEKEALWENFDIYRTLDFSYPDQVHQFINNWFGVDNPNAKGLQDKLAEENRKRLQDLIKNPLRLALLCRIWKRGLATLPETKADFYQLLVKDHYKWKDDRTNKVFAISGNQKKELNRVLAQLARDAIDREDFRFRLRESFIINHDLGEPDDEDSLFAYALKLGWLIDVGFPTEVETNLGEKVYAFFHPTFQEYFAATVENTYDFFLPHEHRDRPVKDENNPKEYKRYRIFEPQWKEVILLWLGRKEVEKKQKEEFIQALLQFQDGCGQFYWYRAYILAAAGIAEFGGCSRVDEIVSQIVHWSFGYFNEEKQKWQTPKFYNFLSTQARAALKETKRLKAVKALTELINHSQHDYACMLAAGTLGEIDKDNKTAIATLVEFIGNPDYGDIGWRAAWTLGKIGKGSSAAIAALVEIIVKHWHPDVRGRAADSLDEIGKGSPTAIAALVEIIRKPQYAGIIHWYASSLLGAIGKGNSDVSAALVELIRNSQEDVILMKAAESLGKIDEGNPTAIAILLELSTVATYKSSLLDSSSQTNFRMRVIESLGEIGKGNQQAVEVLVDLIKISQDEYTRWLAAESLAKIDEGNPTAIAALLELIQNSKDIFVKWRIDDLLRERGQGHIKRSQGDLSDVIGKSNPIAIKTLVELTRNYRDEYIRRRAAECLGRIDEGNSTAIITLVELTRNSQDEYTRRQAADSLGRIGSGNQQAVEVLIELITNTQDSETRRQAANSLGKIGSGNQQAVEALIELITNTQDSETRRQAANSLGKIGSGNQQAVEALIELITNTQDSETRRRAVKSLIANLGEAEMAEVIITLKDYLSEKTYKNDYWRYENCYEVIGYCTQSMSYPSFYKAWYEKERVGSDEWGVRKTTIPDSQSLNQADLQESLQSAIVIDPQLSQIIHLVSIDISKFIDPNNPAAKIYAQMVKQGCSKSDDGTPKTMQDLQVYWDLLTIESDRTIVLVFYQNPIAEARESFSPTFLTNLSKFEGAICVVTDQPFDHIPLKYFTPSQPIEDVMEWIRAIAT